MHNSIALIEMQETKVERRGRQGGREGNIRVVCLCFWQLFRRTLPISVPNLMISPAHDAVVNFAPAFFFTAPHPPRRKSRARYANRRL